MMNRREFVSAAAGAAWSVHLVDTSRAAHVSAIDSSKPTVLITGSNRGIGLGFVAKYAAEGWNVIATTRNIAGATDLRALAGRFGNVTVERLDVTDQAQIAALANKYANAPIDVLINNAAFHGGLGPEQRFGSYDYTTFERYMATNVFAPLKVSEAFAASVARSHQKKIISITSGLSSLSRPLPFAIGQFQQISKAALNKAMRCVQIELAPKGVIVALISPGTLQTEGFDALSRSVGREGSPPTALPVEQGVVAMVKTIAALDKTYDGSHLDLNGNIMPW